ncbi:MAG: helix-turn-helix domain-containing protein [Streptococcaceae bacterium]|nr:helix-turn-helix domain-containing protein [Streptococcaceae bacterium]
MLSKRQFQIMKLYLATKSDFLTSKDLASSLNVSVRTIKTELKLLQEYSHKFASFELETVSNRGSKLVILDENLFSKDFIEIKKEVQADAPDSENRAKFMIRYLLEQKDYKSKIQLEGTC